MLVGAFEVEIGDAVLGPPSRSRSTKAWVEP
jgi:hypothetical protein